MSSEDVQWSICMYNVDYDGRVQHVGIQAGLSSLRTGQRQLP